MRYRLLIIIAASVAAVGGAAVFLSYSPHKFRHYTDECAGYGAVAHSLMFSRQIGTPLSERLEIAGDNPIMIWMTEQAYKIPRKDWGEMGERGERDGREEAIQEFRIMVEKFCYKTASERVWIKSP